MVSENRQKALQWWSLLTEEEKQQFFNSYQPYTPAKNHTQLTGSEIQNIWAAQNELYTQQLKF